MSNVIKLGRGTHLSIRALADELGVDRDTVSRRLTAASVKPSGKRGGYPVYRLKDVIKAVLSSGEDGGIDPDRLEPFQRKAHYQAEHEKIALERERGELVPVMEIERAYGLIFTTFAQAMDTLPDLLERDAAATPMQLVEIEKVIDRTREELYRALIEEDDADSAVRDRA
jgi:hypothetical protein